ncbi:hypothetical protein BST61_g11580 [Cercospora zeina]
MTTRCLARQHDNRGVDPEVDLIGYVEITFRKRRDHLNHRLRLNMPRRKARKSRPNTTHEPFPSNDRHINFPHPDNTESAQAARAAANYLDPEISPANAVFGSTSTP